MFNNTTCPENGKELYASQMINPAVLVLLAEPDAALCVESAALTYPDDAIEPEPI
jgi:hypothetical protein